MSSVRQGWHHQIYGVDNRLFGPNTLLILALRCWLMGLASKEAEKNHVRKDGMLIMFFLSRVKRKKTQIGSKLSCFTIHFGLVCGLD